MTFAEAVAAVIILSFFFIGFSQVVLPVHTAYNNAVSDLKTARTINFVAESFKNECIKPDRNIDNWKKAVSTANELEEIEIIEMKHDGVTRALKAICFISGERIEIIGLCTL